jgi:SAM-dependent methyltransferase
MSLKRAVGHRLLLFGRRRYFRRRIRGNGIEIGGLNAPWPVAKDASVRYLDRYTPDELRLGHPQLSPETFARVDIVDDAERLSTVESASQDFVIASHVLEHCEDPIGALTNWLRVLKPGGVLVLAVPDKRFTFDRSRRMTTLDHVMRDAAEGAEGSRHAHYREWVELLELVPHADSDARATALEASGFSIHFHVWDDAALRELLVYCTTRSGAVLADVRRNRSENLALVIRK